MDIIDLTPDFVDLTYDTEEEVVKQEIRAYDDLQQSYIFNIDSLVKKMGDISFYSEVLPNRTYAISVQDIETKIVWLLVDDVKHMLQKGPEYSYHLKAERVVVVTHCYRHVETIMKLYPY